MPWIQVKLNTNAENTEPLEELLLTAGADCITLLDAENTPIYKSEPSSITTWPATEVIGLFKANYNTQTLASYLDENSTMAPFSSYKIEILEDRNWELEWTAHFKPMKFGKRLWVYPSWTDSPDKNSINMLLDPGLAFGTGSHPTTALCLQWLEQQCLEGKKIIDYGCGSGILSIAAVLLGAQQTIGIDIDPQALTATVENAKRNDISSEKLHVFLSETEPETTADLVIANILSGTLVQLAPRLACRTKPNGKLALSGILVEQIEEVTTRYRRWFEISETIIEQGWVLVACKRYAI